jgi:hypothetical protein
VILYAKNFEAQEEALFKVNKVVEVGKTEN